MEIRSYTKREFERLNKYSLPKTVPNTECELLIIEDKEFWKKHHTLVKRYLQTSGEYFSNKLYTISALIDNRNILQIPELILPSSLFAIDGKIEGFTMPLIERNFNLGTFLNSKNVSLSKKMKALQSIWHLLEKTMKLEGLEGGFFLGDIHEWNFIYDIEKGIYRAVDLDSSKIGNNNPSVSRYLTTNDKISHLSNKYPIAENGKHISNVQTTMLSYIYMILNTISSVKIHRLSIEEYYSYLQYLKDRGMPSELIDMFALIYTPSKNKIDVEILGEFTIKDEKVLTYDSFKTI